MRWEHHFFCKTLTSHALSEHAFCLVYQHDDPTFVHKWMRIMLGLLFESPAMVNYKLAKIVSVFKQDEKLKHDKVGLLNVMY